MLNKGLCAMICMAMLMFGSVCIAGETKKIQDNSFLIEEAYNQEPGVVQHIQTFQYEKKIRTWDYTFTQEWPVPSLTHQISYTIPVSRVDAPEKRTGLGDIALNYRYQLLYSEEKRVALAPRFSLLLPSGDNKRGLGSEAFGYQLNIPFSLELSDKWVTHWNGGLTYTPDNKEPEGSKTDTLGFNYGASIIWLARENFNLMLEAVGNSDETVEPDGQKGREKSFFIVPGVRFAIDFASGLQVVPGIGIPIGVGSSSGEYGIFLYLSLEHSFL